MLENSLIFGSSGSYEIAGIPVTFEKSDKTQYASLSSTIPAVDNPLISFWKVYNHFYIHTCVHEMGHAITAKFLLERDPHVYIFNDLLGGATIFEYPPIGADDQWKMCACTLAGPLSNMIFSSVKLAGAALISKHISRLVGGYLYTTSITWMVSELLYTFSEALGMHEGDFSQIDDQDHLYIALAAMVSTCALGIFTFYRLSS